MPISKNDEDREDKEVCSPSRCVWMPFPGLFDKDKMDTVSTGKGRMAGTISVLLSP